LLFNLIYNKIYIIWWQISLWIKFAKIFCNKNFWRDNKRKIIFYFKHSSIRFPPLSLPAFRYFNTIYNTVSFHNYNSLILFRELFKYYLLTILIHLQTCMHYYSYGGLFKFFVLFGEWATKLPRKMHLLFMCNTREKFDISKHRRLQIFYSKLVISTNIAPNFF